MRGYITPQLGGDSKQSSSQQLFLKMLLVVPLMYIPRAYGLYPNLPSSPASLDGKDGDKQLPTCLFR